MVFNPEIEKSVIVTETRLARLYSERQHKVAWEHSPTFPYKERAPERKRSWRVSDINEAKVCMKHDWEECKVVDCYSCNFSLCNYL